MEDATDHASLLQGRGCDRSRSRNRRSRRHRRSRRLGGRFLRQQAGSRGENDGKNDGLTNHRRVKDEKVALSIDHEIHFREPDSGTFGHFCHR